MKKISHWKLIALFGALVVVFAAVRIFRSPMLEGNLPLRLTEIDSSKVTEFIIIPAKGMNEEVRVVRSEGWKLKRGSETLRAEQGIATNTMRMLIGLRPDRVVSKKKSKWNDFQVGDSTGTHVKLMAGNTVMTNLWIGRSGFTQTPGQQYGGKSFTYVRLDGEEEVFAVEGFLDAQFNRRFDDWRDKSFMRLQRDSVDKVSFRYPADSSFILEKRMGNWMIGNQPADGAAVTAFLGGLEYKNMGSFAGQAPAGNAEIVVTLGNGNKQVGLIEAWPGMGSWIVRSAHQPDIFFSTEGGAMKDITWGKKKFLPKP